MSLYFDLPVPGYGPSHHHRRRHCRSACKVTYSFTTRPGKYALIGPPGHSSRRTFRWTNTLLFPIYVGALSAGLFLLHAVLLSTSLRELLYPPRADDPEPENSSRPENESFHVSLWGELKENVKSNGGIVIWSFKAFRLLGVIVLIALSVASAINNPQPAHESTLLDMFRKDWGKKRKRKGGKSHLTETELIELAWVAFYVNSL